MPDVPDTTKLVVDACDQRAFIPSSRLAMRRTVPPKKPVPVRTMQRALRLVPRDVVTDGPEQLVTKVDRTLIPHVVVERHDDFSAKGETVFRIEAGGKLLGIVKCETANISSETDWLIRELGESFRSNAGLDG